MHNFKAGVARRGHTDNSLESKGKKGIFSGSISAPLCFLKVSEKWDKFFLISSSLFCFPLLPGHSSINAMGSPFPSFEFQKSIFPVVSGKEREGLFSSLFPFSFCFRDLGERKGMF